MKDANADLRVPVVDLLVDAEMFAQMGSGAELVTIDGYFEFDRKTRKYTNKLQHFRPKLIEPEAAS